MRDRFTLIPEAHLLVINGGRILMLRRFRTGFADGKYSVIAGHIDGGETAIEAVCREAREEAGILVKPQHIQLFHIMHRVGGVERVSFFFSTRQWRGQPHNAEPEKCDDMKWVLRTNLPDNTVPYIRQALALGFEGSIYSEHGWEAANEPKIAQLA